jgi:prepilin-type N-terminal cleavage/methylation domain-containing protein
MLTKNLNKQQASSGFTLLELLVVMIILALLAGIGLMSFGTVQQKSRDSARKQDLASISKALELYHNDYGSYPLSSSIDGQIEGCGMDALEACVWGEIWSNSSDDTLYMNMLPKDPLTNWKYYYRQENNGYYLFARLENEEDPSMALSGGNPAFYANTNCNGESDSCNYVIKSSNLSEEPTIF